MNSLLKSVLIAAALSLVAGCGSSFEWLPEATTASTVSSTPVVAAPVANAGGAQSVVAGSKVTLDGSGSSAADGAALSYAWSFKSRPTGSSTELSSATVVRPTFTADVAGAYVISLVVNDGRASSTAVAVTVTAGSAPTDNAAPVANAGADKTTFVNTLVTLDGSGSIDPNGDNLTYLWEVTSQPTGSGAALSSTTVAAPTFTADVAGTYTFSLTVNDGKLNSAIATVSVTAVNTGSVTVTW